jgi:hypothetical protein
MVMIVLREGATVETVLDLIECIKLDQNVESAELVQRPPLAKATPRVAAPVARRKVRG